MTSVCSACNSAPSCRPRVSPYVMKEKRVMPAVAASDGNGVRGGSEGTIESAREPVWARPALAASVRTASAVSTSLGLIRVFLAECDGAKYSEPVVTVHAPACNVMPNLSKLTDASCAPALPRDGRRERKENAAPRDESEVPRRWHLENTYW